MHALWAGLFLVSQTTISAVRRGYDMNGAVKLSPPFRKFEVYQRTAMEALSGLEQFAPSLPLFHTPSRKICVAVQSIKRASTAFNYVAQTVAALLVRMDYRKYKDDVYIHVFNMEPNPGDHTDIESIADLVPVTNVHANIGNVPKKVRKIAQEAADHAIVLRKLAEMGCKYPLLIEDDALAEEGWVDSLKEAIAELESGIPNWSIVKLYSSRGRSEPPTRRGISDYDMGFSTVAYLINPKYISDLAKELEAMISGPPDGMLPKDHFLNKFEEARGLEALSFEPPIFQHTGIFTSVGSQPPLAFFTNEFLQSPDFRSEGKPIVFDSRQWASH